MDTDVKSRRSYDGKAPQARTRLARAAVVEAARTLFLDRGYAATTIEAISDLSDVPPATVYRLFSSKLGILKALLDVSIVGDDEAISLQDRPHARALLADPDPRRQLAGFAGITRQVNSRTTSLYRILLSAAVSDPEATALLADYTRQRQQGQGRIARSLSRAGALRSKLRERTPRTPFTHHVPRGLPTTRRRPRLAPRTVRTMADRHPHRPITACAHGRRHRRTLT